MGNWCVSRIWREQGLRYGTAKGGLRGSLCEKGLHVHFPPREVCPECAFALFAEAYEASPKQNEREDLNTLPVGQLVIDGLHLVLEDVPA